MDRRTALGLRSLNVWVTPELGKKLDAARRTPLGDVPMQQFVVKLLEEAMERRTAALDQEGR